ncbi:MAG: hypothetical protein HQL57_02360 [Magnetococcales bacterium]|nr:hypothetical protein [Magnetococcales bacterium]MBF0156009.1 hypothetical protein [Magnetococcales bacterium]
MGNTGQKPSWDLRWPDPVAIKVAGERLLPEVEKSGRELNWRLPVVVQMEFPPDSTALPRGLLVSPWGVERIYWGRPGKGTPPVRSALPLEPDEAGRVARGQGVLLTTETGERPVVIAWEPETGHHFVESLLSSVVCVLSVEEAIQRALGEAGPPAPARSISSHLERPVGRRALFQLFRRKSS